MSQTGEVHIQMDSKADRWKWVCPAGHTNWQPTNGGVWCLSCSRAHGIEDLGIQNAYPDAERFYVHRRAV